MLYLIAFLLPPLAVLLSGKPIQALFNIVLCVFLWIPGVIHALLVVHDHYADKRARRVIKAINATRV
ncbi:MAG TPA: YqaE/Pmp3 family membrane protein [Candidatus Kryptonia bacterium]